jgi:hypothetical protein
MPKTKRARFQFRYEPANFLHPAGYYFYGRGGGRWHVQDWLYDGEKWHELEIAFAGLSASSKSSRRATHRSFVYSPLGKARMFEAGSAGRDLRERREPRTDDSGPIKPGQQTKAEVARLGHLTSRHQGFYEFGPDESRGIPLRHDDLVNLLAKQWGRSEPDMGPQIADRPLQTRGHNWRPGRRHSR